MLDKQHNDIDDDDIGVGGDITASGNIDFGHDDDFW